MANCIHYTCPPEILPTVEAVLAASGYTIELPFHTTDTGTATIVMQHGAATVLLTQDVRNEQADIEVWGVAAPAAAQVLEAAPLDLHKQPIEPNARAVGHDTRQ